MSSERPFYGQYAWAFDLLIDRPVAKECTAIAGWLVERGVMPGSTVLDAGCGTGRYAVELGRRGYRVTGIDRSRELIDVATRAASDRQITVSFRVGDLLALPVDRFGAILCRGVLNDIIEDDDRQTVLTAFAGALQPDGVLVADVREWEATLERKLREPVFRKSVATERGTLSFESITEVDRENRLLRLSETHTLSDDSGDQSSTYQFVMRCWTREELASALERAGFDRITYYGAFDPSVQPGAADRLVIVAQRVFERRHTESQVRSSLRRSQQ